MPAQPTQLPRSDTVHAWYLRALADSTRLRMPSVREAARECGVSTRTVQVAVGQLKSQGLLQSKPGGGLWRAGAVPSRQPPISLIRKGWESWCVRLQDALRSGEFRNHTLPPVKDLSIRWNVSAPTLRKALLELVRNGTLARHGNIWRLASAPRSGTAPWLHEVLLVAAVHEGKLRMETHREIEFFRCAEEECRARNLRLRLVGYEEEAQRFVPAEPAPDNKTVGVLFSTWHLQNARKCLNKVLAWGVPVSTWIESSELAKRIGVFAQRKNLAWFSVGYGPGPGRDVGRFLKERGHRRIAYISPFHASTWSVDRLQGLSSILPLVEPFVCTDFANSWSFRDRVEAGPLGQKNVNALLPKELRRMRVAGAALPLAQWHENTYELARDMDILQVMQPLLRQVLARPDLTAWVFANDLCAVLAQGLLQETGLQPAPEQIAFDNSSAAFLYGIDSYEFNTQGMVQSMIHHLLAPRNPLYNQGEILHPRGHVVKRTL
jgi:DNA-binding transcriptional regulator YhcF (GntR family)